MLRTLFILVTLYVTFPCISEAKVIDLSGYGDIVVTDQNNEIIDNLISVSWDDEKNKWIGKVQSMKSEDDYLIVEYDWRNRMFCEEGELIPMPEKSGRKVVRLFQLYTERRDIPLEYYWNKRDEAKKISESSFR